MASELVSIGLLLGGVTRGRDGTRGAFGVDKAATGGCSGAIVSRLAFESDSLSRSVSFGSLSMREPHFAQKRAVFVAGVPHEVQNMEPRF
jgi:hypothetical protein